MLLTGDIEREQEATLVAALGDALRSDVLVARGIATVASATCGAWQWRSDQVPGGRCQRDAERRYWHHPGLAIDPEVTLGDCVARTLLPSLPEAAHDSQLRRDAGRGRRGARALRRLRPLARGTTAAGDADPARRSRGHLSPRRHHLRRLRRQGRRRRRRQRRHRAADPVRPDPARHPGQRMARDGARPAPARDRAEPLHPRRLSRPGDPQGRRHSRPTRCSATPSTGPR